MKFDRLNCFRSLRFVSRMQSVASMFEVMQHNYLCSQNKLYLGSIFQEILPFVAKQMYTLTFQCREIDIFLSE